MTAHKSALKVRLLGIGMGIVLLTSAYQRAHSAAIMSDAAKALLNSLTSEQKAKAVIPFNDDERMNWFYTPVPRKGLPLKEMSPAQQKLAFALLGAGLSQRGFIKASSIMSLEEILKIMENGKGPTRDPDLYFFSIFGEPSEAGTWGYRVEGHHVSQNFTIVNGKVIGAPSFFGTNPAEVREGPRKGLRVLAREEDLGRALVQSLTPEQRKIAIILTSDSESYKVTSSTSPVSLGRKETTITVAPVPPPVYPDILTANSRQAALKGQPSGLQVTKMNANQKELLQHLLDEYANNMPEQLAQAREDLIKKAGGNLYFAWAGGTHPGDPHYYRVQSPSFLVEYDDTQNGANHIHSVWRDFDGDFGRDLLKEHYQASHTAK